MKSGFLTAPILRKSREYPFADFPLPIKLIILQAIQTAWERIVEDSRQCGGALAGEGEEVLTTRLEECLNDLLTETGYPSGFSASLFQTVIREASVTSYDDSSLKKKPDLTFRLVSSEPGRESSSHDGLFVECKIVGPRHSARDYCNKGLLRFVIGEYAWAMPCGMMIGYVWDGLGIEEKLASHLRSGRSAQMNVRFLPRQVPTASVSFPLFETGHQRTWTRNGKGHGDINVLHFWLPLPR
jgi:hypothetical protein